MSLAPDLASILALFISVLALIVSWLAHQNSKTVRKQDLRMRTREELSEAQAQISALPDALVGLKTRTINHLIGSGHMNSSYGMQEKEEQVQMQTEAECLQQEIDRLDTDLKGMTDNELEIILLDAQRLGRSASRLHKKIGDKLTEFEGGEQRAREAKESFFENLQTRDKPRFGGKA